MTAASASLVLPSLNPKALSFHSPKPSSLCFFSSLNLNAKPISVSPSFSALPRLAPKVAVSSEFGALSDEEEEPGFAPAPEFKLFVGNLPFNVDSAQLAELFESAGNVQMVEVFSCIHMLQIISKFYFCLSCN